MKGFLVFVGKRVLFTVPQLLAVSVIVFFLIRLLPGDPTYILAGPYATPERISAVRSQLGLDQPLVTQYAKYLGRTLEGDFGVSWRTSQPVVLDIEQRLPVLSTFLGHGHVADIYRYLSVHPELMGLATRRLEKRWGMANEE